MGSEDWLWRLYSRDIQKRLLWELQNYFLGLLPEEGISPERREAMILCILCFPAIDMAACQDEADSALDVQNTSDGINIRTRKLFR